MTTNGDSGGIGFLGLLQIVFIALKLMGYLSWSWGVVLIPSFVGLAIFVLIVCVEMR